MTLCLGCYIKRVKDGVESCWHTKPTQLPKGPKRVKPRNDFGGRHRGY